MRPSLRALALSLVLAAWPVSAVAQSTPADFQAEVLRQFEGSARRLVALAEAMPAETYSWRPTEGVASVVEVYMHIARYNYMYPAESLGAEAPIAYADLESEITDKETAVEILAASMEHVRSLVAAMPAADVDAPTQLYGRDVPKWAVMLQLVSHMKEHMGQSIAYARMNGVVPPWSR